MGDRDGSSPASAATESAAEEDGRAGSPDDNGGSPSSPLSLKAAQMGFIERTLDALIEHARSRARAHYRADLATLHERAAKRPPQYPPRYFNVVVLCPGLPSEALEKHLLDSHSATMEVYGLPGGTFNGTKHSFLVKDLQDSCAPGTAPFFAVVREYEVQTYYHRPSDGNVPSELREGFEAWYSRPEAQHSRSWIFMDAYFESAKEGAKNKKVRGVLMPIMRGVLVKTHDSLASILRRDEDYGAEIPSGFAERACKEAAKVGKKLLSHQPGIHETEHAGAMLAALFSPEHIKFVFDRPYAPTKNTRPGELEHRGHTDPRQVGAQQSELLPGECFLRGGVPAARLMDALLTHVTTNKSLEVLKGRPFFWDENKELGKGMGGTKVYEGKYEGIEVAVKCVPVELAEYAKKEIKFMGQTDHDNVLRCLSHYEDPLHGCVYLALLKCHCHLMAPEVKPWLLIEAPGGERHLPTAFCHTIAQGIVKGVAELHRSGIVHRDLKPQNILLTGTTDSDKAKVADFGLSKQECLQQGNADALSLGVSDSKAAGTPGWRAPEQQLTESNPRGRQHGFQSKATDIFSLGCVLFYCFTGGSHPYGCLDAEHGSRECEKAIRSSAKPAHMRLLDHLPLHKHLIEQMLIREPWARLRIQAVDAHPVFWQADTTMSFMFNLSELILVPKSLLLKAFNRDLKYTVVRNGDWKAKLPPEVRRYVGDEDQKNKSKTGWDKYQPGLSGLVRVIRNFYSHHKEILRDYPDMAHCIGGPPMETAWRNFMELFVNHHFPSLVIQCWSWANRQRRLDVKDLESVLAPPCNDPMYPPEEYRLNWALQMLINAQPPGGSLATSGMAEGDFKAKLAQQLGKRIFDMRDYKEYGTFGDFLADMSSHVEGRADGRIYLSYDRMAPCPLERNSPQGATNTEAVSLEGEGQEEAAELVARLQREMRLLAEEARAFSLARDHLHSQLEEVKNASGARAAELQQQLEGLRAEKVQLEGEAHAGAAERSRLEAQLAQTLASVGDSERDVQKLRECEAAAIASLRETEGRLEEAGRQWAEKEAAAVAKYRDMEAKLVAAEEEARSAASNEAAATASVSDLEGRLEVAESRGTEERAAADSKCRELEGRLAASEAEVRRVVQSSAEREEAAIANLHQLEVRMKEAEERRAAHEAAADAKCRQLEAKLIEAHKAAQSLAEREVAATARCRELEGRLAEAEEAAATSAVRCWPRLQGIFSRKAANVRRSKAYAALGSGSDTHAQGLEMAAAEYQAPAELNH